MDCEQTLFFPRLEISHIITRQRKEEEEEEEKKRKEKQKR
jgi:hypothetical protein